MPRPKSVVPTYRKHKQSGNAIVTVRTPSGRRQDVSLGKYGSAASKAEYGRLCAILNANHGTLPGQGKGLTVNEIMLPFIRHVDRYHRRPDGTKTHEVVEYRQALKPMMELFGTTPAEEIGPLAIETVREEMIRRDWCRTLINRRVKRIIRMFKWASSKEMIPAAVWRALLAVEGLRRGRSAAREMEPVRPVDELTVKATLPFLSRHVAGMVCLQWLTGMRPGEVCSLRRADVDTTDGVWIYRPVNHKMAYRGEPRVIYFGPKAQILLTQFPTDHDSDHVFSPARRFAEVGAIRAANRKTPRYPSHEAYNAKRRAKYTGGIKDHYKTMGYGKAIKAGVARANERRAKMAGVGNYDPVPHWHPNQIRHSHATKVRSMFGLEHAQVALGHKHATMTELYAERNMLLGAEVAAAVG